MLYFRIPPFPKSNMTSLPAFTPTHPASNRSYAAEEWEKMRLFITQLYRDEAKPLHIVQVILAQNHEFRPRQVPCSKLWAKLLTYFSASMLKKRIRKWELDRNKKNADMLFALKLAFDREAMGKKTVFSIRGRLVTFQDVKHYFHRKGVRDVKAIVAATDYFSPTTQIDCRTPEPEKPDGGRATQNVDPKESVEDLSQPKGNFTASNTSTSAGYVVVAFPDPGQIDRNAPSISAFRPVEQLLYLSQAYYNGIFDNPAWRNNHDYFNVDTLEIFYHHMFDGQLLLEENKVPEAFVYLNQGFDLVQSLLEQQSLLFLPYLFHLLLPDRGMCRTEIVLRLLGFTHQMSSVYWPQLHPIQQSLKLLGCMSLEERGESSRRVFQSVLDRVRIEFDDIPGPLEMDLNALCRRARITSGAEQSLDNNRPMEVLRSDMSEDDNLTLHCKTLALRLDAEKSKESAMASTEACLPRWESHEGIQLPCTFEEPLFVPEASLDLHTLNPLLE
jgi:hypothetical protein